MDGKIFYAITVILAGIGIIFAMLLNLETIGIAFIIIGLIIGAIPKVIENM